LLVACECALSPVVLHCASPRLGTWSDTARELASGRQKIDRRRGKFEILASRDGQEQVNSLSVFYIIEMDDELSVSSSTAGREMDPSHRSETPRSSTTSSVRSAGERERSRSPSVPRSSGERTIRDQRPVLPPAHAGDGDEPAARTPVTRVLRRSLNESAVQSPVDTVDGDACAQVNEGRGAGRPPEALCDGIARLRFYCKIL